MEHFTKFIIGIENKEGHQKLLCLYNFLSSGHLSCSLSCSDMHKAVCLCMDKEKLCRKFCSSLKGSFAPGVLILVPEYINNEENSICIIALPNKYMTLKFSMVCISHMALKE